MGDVGVLTVVSVAVTAMTVRAGWRLVRRRAVLQSVAAVALVAWVAGACVCWSFEIRHHWVQSAASAAVQEISGNPAATVTCMRRTVDMLQVENFNGRVRSSQPTVAFVRADVCAELASWLAGPKDAPTPEQAQAVHVLTHEALHIAGEHDEAVTECSAIALDARTAVTLGASKDEAATLAAVYARRVYPNMPAEYRSDCPAADRLTGPKPKGP